LGDASVEYGYGVDLDEAGNVVVMGWTLSSDFPTTAGAYDDSHNGDGDAFVAKLALPVIASICDQDTQAGRVELMPCHPNPFGGTVHIRFYLPREDVVNLAVHDVQGRLTKNCFRDLLAPGWYEVTWDGTTNRDSRASPGIYFCRIEAGGNAETRKMILAR
jgi:hypothetical protein